MIVEEMHLLLENLYAGWVIECDEASDKEEFAYVQGKKNGLRFALMLFAPTKKKRSLWNTLQETTSKYGWFTQDELDFLDKARDLIDNKD